MQNSFKSTFIFRLLVNPQLNPYFRLMWRVVRPLAPKNLRNKFPISGTYTTEISNGRRIILTTPEADWFSAQLYWQGLYSHESETIALFSILAVSAEVILDIGANIGVFAIVAAVESSKAKVYAFEPVPHVFSKLAKHIEINDLSNITPLNLAISDKNEDISIYIPNSRLATARDASLNPEFRQDCTEIKITARTLDSLETDYDFSGEALLKIDVESSEHFVLSGAGEFIARARPLIVCEVLYSEKAGHVYEVMQNWGYRYLWISNSGLLIEQKKPLGDENYQNNNYIFVPTEKWAQFKHLVNPRFRITELLKS